MSNASVQFIELARQKENEVPRVGTITMLGITKRTYEEWVDYIENARSKNLQILMPLEDLEVMLSDWKTDRDVLTSQLEEALTRLQELESQYFV